MEKKTQTYHFRAIIRSMIAILTIVALCLNGCAERPSELVAVCDGAELRNGVFSYYYWMEYESYVNTWNEAIQTSSDFDPDRSLAAQTRKTDGLTWQQFFINAAMDTYHRHQVLILASEADMEYTIKPEYQARIDSIEADLSNEASARDYVSADALLKDLFFEEATLQDYQTYYGMYVRANAYFDYLRDSIEIDDQVIHQQYLENADAYLRKGADSSDTRCMVQFYDLLIVPISTDSSGEPSEHDWDVAKTAADTLFEEFQGGDRTEAAFAELAKTYSMGSDASGNGEPYIHVYPDQFDTNLNDWLFHSDRRVGDTSIIQAEDGWHILYFIGTENMPYWYYLAATDYAGLMMDATMDELLDTYPLTRNDQNISLAEIAAVHE